MGLAASQAKLLSITSRLSDNELRSQSITAAKMALANKTSEASRKYINALNQNEFIYRTYDDNGNQAYTALTGAQLTTYSPLKNQYGIINSQGQILVSEADATNFINSTTKNEFLAKYGIDYVDTEKTQTVENPEYEEAYANWKEEYETWLTQKPDTKNEKYWTEKVNLDNNLYAKFEEASRSCFNNALGGSSGCYMHVLAHMLYLKTDSNGVPDEQSYPVTGLKTTTGKDFSFDIHQITYSAIYGFGRANHPNTRNMVDVSNAICYGYKGETVYAAEHPEDTTTQSSSEAQKLLSNYTFNENGEKVLKTLKDKCIDLAYALNNRGILGIDYNTTMLNAIKSFQEDMSVAFKQNVFETELYNEDLDAWKELEPQLDVLPTMEESIFKYTDEDMAQWYINLWHRMNGDSDEKVTNNSIETSGSTTATETTTTSATSGKRWDILEDGLMNSKEWLKYALESGAVSMEKVNFTNPTEEGTGLKEATWTSTIYTNMLEVSEQTDEKAIAKAEAEYEQKQREIEAKDKQYDSILKLLDTEHTALQAEYESVKQVITKNTERTLKIYQA